MLRHVVLAGALFLLPLAGQAQQNIKWNLDDRTVGIGNAFPWGSAGVRYQAIVPGTTLGGAALIQDVFVSGKPNSSDLEIDFEEIEIRMGLTAVTTPTTDWLTNSPSPTTVYRGPLRVYFESGAWRGIGLPEPYAFAPTAELPNLCFEVIVWKVANQTIGSNFYHPLASTSLPRAFKHDWVSNQSAPPGMETGAGTKLGFLMDDGNFVVVGSGCAGSSGVAPRISIDPNVSPWPQVGSQLSIGVDRLRPQAPTTLALGTSFTDWYGLSLPLDLEVVSAPGCMVWNDPLVFLPGKANASGQTHVVLTIPNDPRFFGARLYGFWISIDEGANDFGLTTSAGGAMLIGR